MKAAINEQSIKNDAIPVNVYFFTVSSTPRSHFQIWSRGAVSVYAANTDFHPHPSFILLHHFFMLLSSLPGN